MFVAIVIEIFIQKSYLVALSEENDKIKAVLLLIICVMLFGKSCVRFLVSPIVPNLVLR